MSNNNIRENAQNKLYAYSYNNLNDVYIIRGVTRDKNEFEPQPLLHVPSELLKQFMSERSTDGEKSGECKISFSTDRFHAIVDFNGRKFDDDQINEIVLGNKVPPVKKDKIRTMGKLILSRLGLKNGRSIDN